MKKLKLISLMILILSLLLLWLSFHLSQREEAHLKAVTTMNLQRSTIQDIAKTILHTHRYKQPIPERLERDITQCLHHLQRNSQNDPLLYRQAKEFFTLVDTFTTVYRQENPYNLLKLDKLINTLYQHNIDLVVALDRKISQHTTRYNQIIRRYHLFQYLLFGLLLLLLLLLFTQLKPLLAFVQQFRKTSDRIIENASIEGVAPIQVRSRDETLHTASSNFNLLVSQIDKAIDNAVDASNHTTKALEEVEQRIEMLLTLIREMNDSQRESLSKKEDAVIESLETLTELTHYMESLKKELQKLTNC